jgi:amidase
MARLVRDGSISPNELVKAHLDRIEQVNAKINAAVRVLRDSALRAATEAEKALARGADVGPLHGVPFSVKDSIDVAGVRTTAGTLGRRHAEPAVRDATLVARLRAAGGIPIAKTNLPDLLFSFETDNLIYGRTNNPYDAERTSGGSSGGEAALLASGGSPLGLGSDALGSVRLPAAFCGICSIKPTSGRLPRTGHVPGPSGWIEALWQIGPMARRVEDLELAMRLLAYPDGEDLASPPVPLAEANFEMAGPRVAYFTDNGFVPCNPAIRDAVRKSAEFLASLGARVEERRPAGVEDAFELELALLGADGAKGVDAYLSLEGSTQVHPFLTAFLEHFRKHAVSVEGLSQRWAQWDDYRRAILKFFQSFDVVLCPVFPEVAFEHGASIQPEVFKGFSYTMAWSAAGTPAATVAYGLLDGLPVNVQVVTAPWNDMAALKVCKLLEIQFGGWQPTTL